MASRTGGAHTNISPIYWLSFTEEKLFLDDGLASVADLVQHSSVAATEESAQHRISLLGMESATPAELSREIKNICERWNSSSIRLFDYRLNALNAYWIALHQVRFCSLVSLFLFLFSCSLVNVDLS